MSILKLIEGKFPQIRVLTPENDLSGANPVVSYECKYHGTKTEEKLNKLSARKHACSKCANLLNKGHSFNLNQKPLEAKKIKEVSGFFANAFDYSHFLAIDVSTSSTIICKTHGRMEMTLNDHVLGFNLKGCPGCAEDEMTRLEIMKNLSESSPFIDNSLSECLNINMRSGEEHKKERNNYAPTPTDWLDRAKDLFFDYPTNNVGI